jgi:hypothetical protein
MNVRDRVEVEFECDKGWDKLIEPLIDYIEEYNSKVEKEEYKIVITQIKEKFGGIRFYVRNAPEELRDMISDAESDAYEICEFCGSDEDVGQTADGWIITCCKKCAKTLAKKEKRDKKWYSRKNKKVEVIKYEK